MSSLQSLDIALRSATTTPPPQARKTPALAKLIDVPSCIGCKACQVACMQWNDLRDEVGENHGVYDNPRDLTPESWTVMRYSEVEMPVKGEDEETRLEWLIRKDGCMHCEDPGCLKACPAPGAIIKYSNGIVDFISEHCIGCGNCVIGCPFDVPRISKKDDKAYKCSLCSDRVAVNLEPACVKVCPTGAIRFGTKEDMHEYAAGRIVDLKERGFENAGVYDPQGVGGTHVMYVLQHADQPKLYHGLPENPSISPLVSLWKGAAKPLAVAAMIGAAFAGFFHYMKVGPLETTDADEEEAERERLARERQPNDADIVSEPDMAKLIQRYGDRTRLNHWFVAILFICAGLTGLAVFHPSMYFLSNLFGGGQWTRILHPFFGLLMVIGFIFLFFQVVRDNFWTREDTQWVKHSPDLLKGDEEAMPPVGKYNAGQKIVFWIFGISLLLLLVTGFMFWRPWFAEFFPIPVRRIAVLVHAISATVLIISVIIHIYAAIWVKGSVGAMTRGTVSEGWARKHHPLWYRKITGGK